MNTTKPFNWKIFFILLAACVLGIIAVLPYTLELQKEVLSKLPIPLWVLLLTQILQSTILFAIAIGLGLFIANRIGLGLPILEAKLSGESVGARIKAILPLSIILGVVGSVVIVGLDIYMFGPAMKAELGAKAGLANIQGT